QRVRVYFLHHYKFPRRPPDLGTPDARLRAVPAPGGAHGPAAASRVFRCRHVLALCRHRVGVHCWVAVRASEFEIDMQANTYPSEPHRLSQARQWYGFSAAAIAWALEGVIGVIVSAQFCPADLPHWGLVSQTSVKVALGLVTLVLLAIA